MLFTTLRRVSPIVGEDAQLAVLSLETGEVKVIGPGSYPRYVPTGHVVYGVQGNLWAVAFDLNRLETVGDPVPVQEGVLTKAAGTANFSVAENGSLVYMPGTAETAQGRTLVWVDRSGEEEPLAVPESGYVSLSLSPDGTRAAASIINSSGNADVWVSELARGTLTRLTTLEEGELGHWWPHFLPEERAVLFTAYKVAGATVEVFSMDTGQRHTILDGSFARYVPTGHLLFVQNEALMAVPFDLELLEAQGAAVPVLDEMAYMAEEAGSQYATSDSGTLVYLTAAAMNPLMALTAVDLGGNAELLFQPDRFVSPRVSPDGGHVAVVIKDADYTPDLWVLDLDRGSRTRITDQYGAEPNAVWTWQGDDLIVAYEGAEGVPYFRAGRAATDGSGRIEPLLASNDGDVIPSSLTPDGRVLAYVLVTHTSQDIWTMPLDGGGEPVPFVGTTADEGMPAFSPSGGWIAYQSNDSGRFEILRAALPGTRTADHRVDRRRRRTYVVTRRE